MKRYISNVKKKNKGKKVYRNVNSSHKKYRIFSPNGLEDNKWASIAKRSLQLSGGIIMIFYPYSVQSKSLFIYRQSDWIGRWK